MNSNIGMCCRPAVCCSLDFNFPSEQIMTSACQHTKGKTYPTFQYCHFLEFNGRFEICKERLLIREDLHIRYKNVANPALICH